MSENAQYVVGIDLGTTNTILAYASLNADQCVVTVLPLEQLVAAGTIESRDALPSFLYLATGAEATAGAFDLQWREGADFAAGEVARRQSVACRPWRR